jgi:DNA-binding transcriptional LysR family regulator
MNWSGLNEFISVAETHSFTQAAKNLGVSAAHISRKIQEVEDRLGSKLFYRTTRTVSLTETGQLYYQQYRPLIEAFEDVERNLSDFQTQPKGLLRITAPAAYGEQNITPLINKFVQTYKEIDIDIHLTNRKIDIVNEGFDLAIRIGHLSDSSLNATKLASRQLHICAATSYLKHHGTPYSLSELKDHNCLLGTMDHWRITKDGKPFNLRVQGRIRCNSGPTLLKACLDGLGIVQLPDYYVQSHMDQNELQPLLTDFTPEEEGIWAVYAGKRHLSAKVRCFINFLKDNLV